MKIFTATLILSLVLLSVAIPADNLSWGKDAQGLRCSLSTSSKQWSKGSPVMVTLLIENITSEQKDFTVTAGFNLGQLQYWSPVKLAKESDHLPANASYKLSIGPHDKLRYEIDMTKLKWAKNISSIWPFQDMFSVVPPGKYNLSCDIHLDTNTNPNWIHSNEIEILVQ